MIPLRRKIEQAFISYVASQLGTTAGQYRRYLGSSVPTTRDADGMLVMQPPCIVVFCESLEDAFDDAMPKSAGLNIGLMTSLDDTPEASHLQAVAEVESAMQALALAQAHVGPANATRSWAEFYLYDINENGQSTDFEDRRYNTALRYTIVCEGQDND
jgi:hypothetical protein